ncbi:MAG TPA: hypothetical protein VKT99_24805 [Xanthobacteraceae bacterium]|nr:hypothetical protein [Xanthobacteraceae bacterium]
MDRAVVRIGRGMAERRVQEGREFRARHLAAAHRKIAVGDGAEPRDVAGDRNVPRGIGKNHLGPLVAEQQPDLTLMRLSWRCTSGAFRQAATHSSDFSLVAFNALRRA